MLPKLWRDPSYLDRLGYEVSNSRGREVASNSVDWAAVATQQIGIDVRQPPGRSNALGRLKIDFPNKHAIYMHDTNQKHLFAREQRALSHGCVRLERPNEMAAALLGTRVADVERKIATEETRTERVPGDIAVYLALLHRVARFRGQCALLQGRLRPRRSSGTGNRQNQRRAQRTVIADAARIIRVPSLIPGELHFPGIAPSERH